MQDYFNEVCLNVKQYYDKCDLLSRWTQLQHMIAVIKITFERVISSCPDIQQLFCFHDARVVRSDVFPEILVKIENEFELESILWEVRKIFANKVLAQCEGTNRRREFFKMKLKYS